MPNSYFVTLTVATTYQFEVEAKDEASATTAAERRWGSFDPGEGETSEITNTHVEERTNELE